ncbi:MAG: hypothetical protein ABI767_16120 [Rhodanobacter sp.]
MINRLSSSFFVSKIQTVPSEPAPFFADREWQPQGVSDDELIAIRQRLQRERAVESKRFQAMAEKTLGRLVSLRRAGRPRHVDTAPEGF